MDHQLAAVLTLVVGQHRVVDLVGGWVRGCLVGSVGVVENRE